jgi:hypothetical protein
LVTYTSSPSYWAPLKPRIRIYAFNDTTYATPLYSYDPFTDTGRDNKPISLRFESLTTNAGTFSLEIEDPCSLLDPDLFMKGNRVFIDCSKDGSTYQPAFKGLVRSSDQQIYGSTGRNLILNGYSYLIRLNERVVNVVKESSLTGTDYNRSDSNMFSNNLINDLLNTDANYVYMVDDTAAYSIMKTNDIPTSPVSDWIPRLDASLVTVGNAIDSVLEFSNGLVMLDLSTDQLQLYNPDQVTSKTGLFLLTDQLNKDSDDADITMYPVESYKYNISYDYPDSGSRLIASIGNAGECPAEEVVPPVFNYAYSIRMGFTTPSNLLSPCPGNGGSGSIRGLMTSFQSPLDGTLKGISVPVASAGNLSGSHNSVKARIYRYTNGSSLGAQVGPDITLYKDGVAGTPFPSVNSNLWFLHTESGWQSGALTILTNYYFGILDDISNNSAWWSVTGDSGSQTWIYTINYSSPSWWGNGNNNPFGGIPLCLNAGNGFGTDPLFHIDLESTSPRGACGGSAATADADPVFAVAHDRNMSNKIGVVEKAISSIPTHVKTKQTMNEYLFNKLYVAAKPRFMFDFPSVTMPNKMPKAGDVVCHVSTKANVGLKISPVQTGVIDQVSYDFAQGDDGVLGLRKLGLSTTGIRRGYY